MCLTVCVLMIIGILAVELSTRLTTPPPQRTVYFSLYNELMCLKVVTTTWWSRLTPGQMSVHLWVSATLSVATSRTATLRQALSLMTVDLSLTRV